MKEVIVDDFAFKSGTFGNAWDYAKLDKELFPIFEKTNSGESVDILLSEFECFYTGVQKLAKIVDTSISRSYNHYLEENGKTQIGYDEGKKLTQVGVDKATSKKVVRITMP